MSKADHARTYIIKALTEGPQTAKQLAAGAGISIEYMRGIIHAALDAGTINAERTGPFYTYYIGDTAPKYMQTKAKAQHKIPTKSVTVPALTRLGLFEPAKVTLPKEPWEVHP